MPKKLPPSPGTVLKSLLDEYQLNPTKLGAEIKTSQSAVYQIVIGKTKISVPMAVRLAKYFGKTPEFWLNLQTAYDLAEAANDTSLTAIVKTIPKAKKTAPAKAGKAKAPAKKPGKKAATVKKTGKKPAAKKTVKAKADKAETPPKKRGRKPGSTKTKKVEAPTPVKKLDVILIKKDAVQQPAEAAPETPPQSTTE
jgi:addiction module HigA family antidote